MKSTYLSIFDEERPFPKAHRKKATALLTFGCSYL